MEAVYRPTPDSPCPLERVRRNVSVTRHGLHTKMADEKNGAASKADCPVLIGTLRVIPHPQPLA